MPTAKLLLQPGVNLQQTPTLNKTQWASSQLVRFYAGLLQKLGGWARFTNSAVIGTCRSMLGWADLLGNPYIAIGTEQRLQVLIGGSPFDITPVMTTTNPAVSFSTTSGSATVTITDSHAPNVGDWINLVTQVSVGGLILVGYYQVVSVGSGNYTVTAAANATSTVSNGGAVAGFAVVNMSPTVTVTFANHGLTASTSSFNVPVSTTVGGITLSGSYVVASVTNANVFTIAAGSSATSTASGSMNGGNAQIQYLLSTGQAENVALSGWGIGLFGSGYWGLANGTSGIAPMRIWSLDHYGQDLVACPNGGAIYYWQPNTSVSAQVVATDAPTINNFIVSVAEVQILMALASTYDNSTQQPLLVKWSDASNAIANGGWTPTATNQAGSFELSSGSTLIAGAASGLNVYLWTDLGIWTASYLGLPYVFSFSLLATECGAISSRAIGLSSIGAAWLSAQGFFQLTGSGVTPMECPVWDFYINNVDITQLQAITCAVNSAYHEISWFYPVVNGGTYYVKWNWLENVWDIGVLVRTAWMDASPAGNAMGVDGNGLIQQHEVGFDADGSPLVSSASTGYFDAAEGDQFVFLDMLMPDFNTASGATISLTVNSQDYSEGVVTVDGPHNIQIGTAATGSLPQTFVTCNSRGRQLALTIGSADLGSSWRLGALRYQFKPDGKI